MLGTVETKSDLAELCQLALASAPDSVPPDLPIDPKLGVPGWYDFEHAAWSAGEQARQSFGRHPAWKKDAGLRAGVLEVAVHHQLRRGRQSWVMALGFVGAREHAPVLAGFLSDPDVDGQALDTLIKMRAGGYAAQVWPLASHNEGWVRKLARRYLKRYAAAA